MAQTLKVVPTRIWKPASSRHFHFSSVAALSRNFRISVGCGPSRRFVVGMVSGMPTYQLRPSPISEAKTPKMVYQQASKSAVEELGTVFQLLGKRAIHDSAVGPIDKCVS